MKKCSETFRFGGLLVILLLLSQYQHASARVILGSSQVAPSPLSPLDITVDHDALMSSTSTNSKAVVSDALLRRGGSDGEGNSLAVRLKIGGYFALWYILNIVYNSEC